MPFAFGLRAEKKGIDVSPFQSPVARRAVSTARRIRSLRGSAVVSGCHPAADAY
jgi:hypothetical protein